MSFNDCRHSSAVNIWCHFAATLIIDFAPFELTALGLLWKRNAYSDLNRDVFSPRSIIHWYNPVCAKKIYELYSLLVFPLLNIYHFHILDDISKQTHFKLENQWAAMASKQQSGIHNDHRVQYRSYSYLVVVWWKELLLGWLLLWRHFNKVSCFMQWKKTQFCWRRFFWVKLS